MRKPRPLAELLRPDPMLRTVCFVLALAVGGISVSWAQTAPAEQSPEVRADALLARMTVREKVGQLHQRFLNFGKAPTDEGLAAGDYGSFLYARDVAAMNRLQQIAVEKSRLHIPLIFALDVINGYRTTFPAPIGLAASWDMALIEEARRIAAREARAAGITWTFAPMVDIARDPRWGRIVEGAGEDPFLGSRIAVAQVRGFQGAYPGAPDRILATAKHFAAYGAAIGGRDYEESAVPESDLWNIYFPPFRAAIDAGVVSVMSAYQDLNDVPATGNRWLMHDVLRDAFGFKGFVVSDAYAVGSLVDHGFARDQKDATWRAFSAGVNIDMDASFYLEELPGMVEQGRITVAQLDAMVRPFLIAKFQLGLFEKPYVDEAAAVSILTDPSHREAARIAAERSAVLLKNANGLLPLDAKKLKSVAVIGPVADNVYDPLGPWTTTADLKETVTVLAGIRTYLPKSVKVEYARGAQIARKFASEFDQFYDIPPEKPWTAADITKAIRDAVAVAKRSDVAILVLGEAFNMSGESASRAMLTLPGNQERLLEAVIATGKPVVVVLINGRPLDVRLADAQAGAILEAWYPGMHAGTAIARLLFGDVTPGGKLPFTWPRHAGQIPIHYNHNLTMRSDAAGRRTWDEESVPQYPFGYGLSYASFAYSNLRVVTPSAALGEAIEVAVDVENVSDRAGDEVAQLYIHQRAGSASRPVRELKGFERIALAPHARTTVKFTVPAQDLRYWSGAQKAFVQEAEAFDVWVGTDSRAELHGEFAVHP